MATERNFFLKEMGLRPHVPIGMQACPYLFKWKNYTMKIRLIFGFTTIKRVSFGIFLATKSLSLFSQLSIGATPIFRPLRDHQ
jgi:hypothetical protein